MASVELYRDEVRLLCGKEIGEERKRLLKAIDGDAFPPLKSWPTDKTHVLEEAARVEKRLAQRGVLLILRGLNRCKNTEKRMNEPEVS